MRFFGRILTVLVVIVIVLGLVAGGGFLYITRKPFPQISGTLRVAGLQNTVTVIRDKWGVPHIYADNPHDLFLAQGYVHAQDRLWQMEFNRRVGAGRPGVGRPLEPNGAPPRQPGASRRVGAATGPGRPGGSEPARSAALFHLPY